MSWRRLCSRAGDPAAPRKYFVVTMLVALADQKSGNSTPRCSKLIEPSRQLVMTTSRRSQVTASYGCTPGVVKTRSTRRLCNRPLGWRLEPRWVGLPGVPFTVSVMEVLSHVYNTWWAAIRPRLRRFLLVRFAGRAGWCGTAPGVSGGSGSRGGRHFHRGRCRVMGATEVVDVRRCAALRESARSAELGDLGLEVGERRERAVDRREPHVGDLVELTQRRQDGEADLVRGHLGAAAAPDRLLDLLGEQGERVLRHRPAGAGLADAVDDLCAAERLGDAGPLDDAQAGGLDRGEPAAALRAGPAPADGGAVVGLAGVDHPRVGVPAERAVHRQPPPGRMYTPCG